MKCATFLRICRPFVKLRLVKSVELTEGLGYSQLITAIKDEPSGTNASSVLLDDGCVGLIGHKETIWWLKERAKKKGT